MEGKSLVAADWDSDETNEEIADLFYGRRRVRLSAKAA
jgi:hypothetical protein